MLAAHAPDARARASTSAPSARSCCSLVGVYLLSSVFSWVQAYIMAGVTQRTVYRLRQDVDEKLGRLPLKYFDSHPRGDILSRVTNDIDNIGQTLQQSLTQLITVAAHGHRRADHDAHDQPAPGRHLAARRARSRSSSRSSSPSRSQKQFVAQWASTGDAQRPRRGDAHRPRHREGLRAPARRRSPRSTRRTSGSTTRATGRSSSPGSSSRR